ncbi:hypothetical protein J5U23_01633 [Saccharolobus shibatae B12]|uniref:Uncharacterized protein n=2 Tax=Saccharolobus shibatae TaxID=2286 RepID=A0A8F5BP41_SACSH|nr:hypothetical protein J5U23_01633 [Saccharolobus shibatae B12]QXJ32073.1 hypothetical protein J5U21_01724 [Saccharolobus shibatae]
MRELPETTRYMLTILPPHLLGSIFSVSNKHKFVSVGRKRLSNLQILVNLL